MKLELDKREQQTSKEKAITWTELVQRISDSREKSGLSSISNALRGPDVDEAEPGRLPCPLLLLLLLLTL